MPRVLARVAAGQKAAVLAVQLLPPARRRRSQQVAHEHPTAQCCSVGVPARADNLLFPPPAPPLSQRDRSLQCMPGTTYVGAVRAAVAHRLSSAPELIRLLGPVSCQRIGGVARQQGGRRAAAHLICRFRQSVANRSYELSIQSLHCPPPFARPPTHPRPVLHCQGVEYNNDGKTVEEARAARAPMLAQGAGWGSAGHTHTHTWRMQCLWQQLEAARWKVAPPLGSLLGWVCLHAGLAGSAPLVLHSPALRPQPCRLPPLHLCAPTVLLQ